MARLDRGTVAAAGTPVNEDLTASPGAARAEVPPAVLATSLAEYGRGWWLRLRGGDSGILPVVLGMVVIAIVFQVFSPANNFLAPSNLVFTFNLGTVYMVMAMAEIAVLLLGEIDLSVGPVAILGGIIAFKLVQAPAPHWTWWAAALVALLCTAAIGLLQGLAVARLRVPSFVVTLAGFLVVSGLVVIAIGGASGTATLNQNDPNQFVLYALAQLTVPPLAAWIALAVVLGVAALVLWTSSAQRRRKGLVAPPRSVTALRIALIAALGVAVVAICNANSVVPGAPWTIPIVLVVLALWTVGLQRTRFGRYIYAIGGNAEAARRAGVNLATVRTLVFVLCSTTAGLAGILFGSFLSFYTSGSADPGQFVLYAVAAAVIGGTSLFGGRGKAIHGVLGGLLIGGIDHGMTLLQLPAQWDYIVTGAVLLTAVLVDVLSRRSSRQGALARA